MRFAAASSSPATAASRAGAILAWLPTAALTFFRVRLGLLICWGGLAKCLPLPAPTWFVEMVGKLGFTYPSPVLWAVLAIWGEALGGLLLALGLWTRWAAAQLAFQFAVIAFLWYDQPEFLTGLYLQQEMFWALALLLGLGGGAWSLDAVLARRAAAPKASAPIRHSAPTARPLVAALAGLLIVLTSAPVSAAPPTASVGHLQAHLPLRPLETVSLGAGRPTGFTLRAHNVGRRCVELLERTPAGDTLSRGLLGPGATVTLAFPPGAGAFVLNPGAQPALRSARRTWFEFEVINGTDEQEWSQFLHQPVSLK